MSRDSTASLESEYEPSHDETDDRAVIGSSICGASMDPICGSPGEDDEMEF
ncbi:hypothetical protein [Halorussus pelagicus]|uniref:hypothetical protein n=1 Tax=Halorussus pelagicus TaxID=2505977 RepID=UPI00140C0568|nr:hypothetical protein [Halorussus pelagicus]